MKIVDSSRMAEIDRQAQEQYSIPGSTLMENAGVNTVTVLTSKIWKDSIPQGLFVFLCGKGNNAGDAFVMARCLFNQGKTDICIIKALGDVKAGSDAEKNFALCLESGILIIDLQKDQQKAEALLDECTVLFDGIFGTGLTKPISGNLEILMAYVNTLECVRIAIDIPSGIYDSFLSGQPAFHADLTCTMELPKQSLYLPAARPLCGEILPVKLGFPDQLIEACDIPGNLLQDFDIFTLVPDIPLQAYKKTRGHAAVFAGAQGTTGAAVLSSTAAARSGAGLVTLFTDPLAYPVIAAQSTSVMVQICSQQSLESVLADKTYTAVCAGPGMGISPETSRLIEKLIDIRLPKVIDADGLTLLTEIRKTKEVSFKNNAVLTPHPGECARLIGCTTDELLTDPIPKILQLAKELDAVIVLKSSTTYISDTEGRFWIFDYMNPGLGTGGTGDVLAGIITGLIAQKTSPLDAALAGVLIHSKAGMIAFEELGWFLAEDLLSYISAVSCFHGRNEYWQ